MILAASTGLPGEMTHRRSPRTLSEVRGYGLALLSTGLATWLWLLLGTQLVPSPFVLFLAAIAITAWWGALGPALMAIGLSTLASLLLYVVPADPQGLTPKQELLYLLVFLLISLLIASLHVARHRAEEAFAQQALHDSLTKLPNRRLFCDRLAQAIKVAQRHQTACAVLLLDLDGFKQINDQWGHATGDLLLHEISRRLEGSIRASDTVARWGGDEFALVLTDSGTEGAIHTAQRVLQELTHPLLLAGTRAAITPSIGIALYPEHGHDDETLLHQADMAMYRCKRAGGRGYALPEDLIATCGPSDTRR
jgi:diguanylate cyclase (GGDEF)-like protein